MKIALDVSPLETGHRVRGVGFYVQHLRDALVTYFPSNEYLFFTNEKELHGNIDVVHYPYFDPFHTSYPITKKYPTIVTVHDLTPLIFPKHFPAGIKGRLTWFRQKQQLKKTAAIITDSRTSKNDIVQLTNVKDEAISVVYLAAGEEFGKKQLKSEAIKSFRDKYKLPHKFVLYVGDATWNKNLPRLIHAIKATDIPLVMVGKALTQHDIDKNNVWTKDLRKVQELTHNDEQITMLGFIPTEDLVTLYNLATVFAYPSVYEGFGLPIVEAMQSGCPVIISKEGCMSEVGGEAAYYFDGYHTVSLVDAITKVFNNELLQQELKIKGLQQASKFTWKNTAEETIEVYKRIYNS